MNCVIYIVSTALSGAVVLNFAVLGSVAQTAPQISRLTPLQRQQLSRDLVPSGAQDFFKAGQVTLEREIQLLTQQRSSLDEKLLNVRQDSQMPPNERFERPSSLLHDRAK